MLWTVSNTFENIQFTYIYESKSSRVPSAPHNEDSLRNKRQYLYFNKKDLQNFKKLSLLYKGLLHKTLQLPFIKKYKKKFLKKKRKLRVLRFKKIILSPTVLLSLDSNITSSFALHVSTKKKTFIQIKFSLGKWKFFNNKSRKRLKITRRFKRYKLGRVRIKRYKNATMFSKRLSYKYYNINLKAKVLKKYKFSKKSSSSYRFVLAKQLIFILSKKTSKKPVRCAIPDYFFSQASHAVPTIWENKKEEFTKRNKKRTFYDYKRKKKKDFLAQGGSNSAKVFERLFWDKHGLYMQKELGVKDFTKKKSQAKKSKKNQKKQDQPKKVFFFKARELKRLEEQTLLNSTDMTLQPKNFKSSGKSFFKNAFKKQQEEKEAKLLLTNTPQVTVKSETTQEILPKNKKNFLKLNKKQSKLGPLVNKLSTPVEARPIKSNDTSGSLLPVSPTILESNKKVKKSKKILKKKNSSKKKKSTLIKVKTPDGKFVFLTRPVEIIIKKKRSKIFKLICKNFNRKHFFRHHLFSFKILIKLKIIRKYLSFLSYKQNVVNTIYKNREDLFMPNKMLKVFNSNKPLWYYAYKLQKKLIKKTKRKSSRMLKKLVSSWSNVRSSRRIFWKSFKFNVSKRLATPYRKLKEHARSFLRIKRKFPKIFFRFEQFKKLARKRKKRFFWYLSKNHPLLASKRVSLENKLLFKSIGKLKMSLRQIWKNWTSFDTKFLLKTNWNSNLIENNKKSEFAITNFLWLNEKTYETYLLNFFFVKNKLLTEEQPVIKKTFFFNFRNKRLKTYRNARKTHWNFFTTKTLKKCRYQNFLNFFLKKQNSLFYQVFTFFVFKFRLSYKFWMNFNFFYQTYYTITKLQKQIFQIPIHTSFWDLIKRYDLFKQKVDTKISYWQNKRLQIRKTFWMQQKKKVPTFFKKKIFEITGAHNCIQYDFITNYFTLIKKFRNETHTNLFIFKNKYLKLHGFKYNS